LKYVLLLLINFTFLIANDISVDSMDKYNITPQVTYYLDEKSTLNHQNVLSKKFIDSNKPKLMFGYKYNATLWIKFTLVNSKNNPIEKILEYDYPILKEFTLFDLGTGEKIKGGFLHANEYKDTINKPINLVLPANSKKHFLIKANSTDVSLIAKLILWNPDKYNSNEMQRQRVLFLFFGAMSALLAYNLFLFFFTRDQAYFYYSIIMLTFLSLELFLQGFFTFIDATYEVKKWHVYTLLYVMLLGLVIFTSTFLQLKKAMPSLHRKLVILIAFMSIMTIGSILNILPTEINRLILLLSFYILTSIGFYAYYKKIPQAKYYLIGWMLLLISTTILGLNQLGYANLVDKIPYLNKINIFAEALLFSIALSARIRSLQQDKQKFTQKLYEQKTEESSKLEEKVKERTEALEKALKDKHLLVKEVHHRVKNNLQIVISLLRLQSDESNDIILHRILEESENRIRAISNVHELLYQNETLQNINTQEYFEQLAQDIQVSLGKNYNIKLTIDAKESLSMDKAIYCGLIANELITNAFKYAFNGGAGELNIRLKENNGFTYIISDNGKGISSDVTENLGMVLVKTLVKKQLKGSIVVDNTNGTKYIIKFGSDE